jgi:hypothetical protein
MSRSRRTRTPIGIVEPLESRKLMTGHLAGPPQVFPPPFAPRPTVEVLGQCPLSNSRDTIVVERVTTPILRTNFYGQPYYSGSRTTLEVDIIGPDTVALKDVPGHPGTEAVIVNDSPLADEFLQLAYEGSTMSPTTQVGPAAIKESRLFVETFVTVPGGPVAFRDLAGPTKS